MYPPMNVYGQFRRIAESRSDEPAIIGSDGSEYSFWEVDQQARQVAAWLEQQGLGDGERIPVYIPDRSAYIPVVLGIWRAGCVANPVNTRFGIEELEYTLNDVRPSALITSSAFEDQIDEIVDRVEFLHHDVVIKADIDGEFPEAKFPDPEEAPETAKKLDEDPLEIMYTSGTTGKPKGVIHTHRNVSSQIEAETDLFNITASDTAITPIPLFHVGGLHGIALPTLYSGGTVVIQESWDSEQWAKLVEEHDVTFSGFIATLLVDAIHSDAAQKRDTSSLRLCVYGGSPAAKSVLEEFKDIFDVDGLMNYYGQTEVSGLSVTTNTEIEPESGLIGRPTPAVRTRIVDVETQLDVQPGEVGELLVKGDVVTPGYWNRDDLNQTYFVDGWLRTDDVAREDENGLLHYVDRADDMIISGGENVAPSAVENALSEMPDIEAIAVFGTPHERWGEVVTAAIIPASPDLSEDDVQSYWDEEVGLAGYEKPRRIVFVDEFPRTASQKIDKSQLVEQVTE